MSEEWERTSAPCAYAYSHDALGHCLVEDKQEEEDVILSVRRDRLSCLALLSTPSQDTSIIIIMHGESPLLRPLTPSLLISTQPTHPHTHRHTPTPPTSKATSNHGGRGTSCPAVGHVLSVWAVSPRFVIHVSDHPHTPAPAHSPFPSPHAHPAKQKYLIFGKNGWIGGKLIDLLKEQGKTVVLGQSRLENREALFAELDEVKPTHVLDAAGVTGRPNIDWCETHQVETIRTNVIGTLNLAEGCHLKGIHMTLYATGCIFEYDEKHPIGGPGFTEEDAPNFFGSFYSKTKAYMEDMLKSYKNVCILRVRMPISDDLNPRNFVTKIVSYDRVVDVPNSMTVLTDLLPISLIMSQRKLTGTSGGREGRREGGRESVVCLKACLSVQLTLPPSLPPS